ncbi:hypothetical protein PIB30_115956, partial [Stylosanthes scabra]|nr:hypothetical protein [Stylosanthes scabra]
LPLGPLRMEFPLQLERQLPSHTPMKKVLPQCLIVCWYDMHVEHMEAFHASLC